MTIINNLKSVLKSVLAKKGHKHNGRVIQVTITRLYTVPECESMSDEDLKREWFEEYDLSRSHAYRDANHIGGADNVIEVKFLTEKDVDSL